MQNSTFQSGFIRKMKTVLDNINLVSFLSFLD